MAIEKLGIDYHLVEYRTWVMGIPDNPKGYAATTEAHISSHDQTLWTKRFVLRLL